MTTEELERAYRVRYATALEPLANNLRGYIRSLIEENQLPRIDRVDARAKSVERFLGKARKEKDGGGLKYSDPLSQIQDQVGARIVTFYRSDIERVGSLVNAYFTHIEKKTIVPDSVSEFGYEGQHFILFLPQDLMTRGIPRDLCPRFFELQIKTLFQHAWGEASHDLDYKPPVELELEHRRKVAFTAAQAWGADQIFDELASEVLDIRRANQH